MSEPENKKPNISKVAITFLVFSLIGFVCSIPGYYLFYLEIETASAILLTMALLCLGLCFIFGLVALIAIPFSKNIAKKKTALVSIIAGFICFVTLGLYVPTLGIVRPIAVCECNCRTIYQYMRHYNRDYDEKLIPNKWCDILIQKEGIGKQHLICCSAHRKGYKGPCNYAINPYCEPNSPNDVVILFETKGGWNQHGGPELISFNNHVRKGANILFKDGHVEFVKPEDVNKLKWK